MNTQALSKLKEHPQDISCIEEDYSGMTWQAAAQVLLRAVGYLGDTSNAATLSELAKSLRGNGFVLEKATISGGTIPATEGRMGCLLELHDGQWLPYLGGNEDATLLSETGEPGGAYGAFPMRLVKSAWVLNERVVSLRSVATFLQKYKPHFVDLFVSAIIVNVFALTLPLFSSFVYDKILGNGILDTLWALVIGISIILGVEFCVRTLRINVAERFAVESEIEIDYATFQNLLNTRANKMPTIGAMLEKYKQILLFRDFLSSTYILALADLPFLFLFLFAIAFASGPLVLVSLVCGGLMLLTSLLTIKPVLDYDREARSASERRFSLMTDLMTSREAVVGSALRNKLAERWRQASVSSSQTASKARYWRGLSGTITSSISYISFIGILVGGVYMVEDHSLTSGGLLAASLLTSRTMGSFASVNMLLLRYREFRTALRELNQLTPPAPARNSQRHGRLQGSIRFDKVTCRLRQGDTPVLDGISLNISPGELVAVAGSPGAGKTTLLRLLAGLLDPDEGRILIDGIPLDNLAPEDLSLNIGFKPQDFCLLDGTVEDNVRAGRPPMTPEMRQEALILSGLGRVFNEGALHWMSTVGPRGSSLSGGQRQMVSLARALVSRPSIILLDEPTNGLDAALENHLASQLLQLRGRSTILVSTHSRSILQACDRIIVVGQSRILADGPRDKILV
jgi:ATP-binding cassette subfamily B protein/ATP-binding cassette subfamily C protein LapB